MTDVRRFCSGQHSALRRWKNLITRSEKSKCRLCSNEEKSYDHLWFRYPVFDVDRQRLDVRVSLDELIRLPTKTRALLRIILMRTKHVMGSTFTKKFRKNTLADTVFGNPQEVILNWNILTDYDIASLVSFAPQNVFPACMLKNIKIS